MTLDNYSSGPRKTAWSPDFNERDKDAEINEASFLSGIIRCSGINSLAIYALSSIVKAFGFSDPMLIAVDGEKYLIKRLVHGEIKEDVAVDDKKRNLLKYVSRQKKPVNRFEFSKGRLLTVDYSIYDEVYAFGLIVPLCSLERTSGFLLFNHPTNRRPLTEVTAAFFDKIMIPLGLALDLATVMDARGKTDPETGLLQKTVFLDEFDQELRRTALIGNSLTVGILQYQDMEELSINQGEAAAYEVEVLGGNKLRNSTRSNDLIFRFGNGRFVVILTETPRAQGEAVILRLMAGLEQLKPAWALKVKCGIAGFPENGDTTKILYTNADSALDYGHYA